MATLHHYLSSLTTELDRKSWEEIINRALYLFETHPPDALEDLAEQWKLKWYEYFHFHFVRMNPERFHFVLQ